MKTEFSRTFAKDLGRVSNQKVIGRIRKTIEDVRRAGSLSEIQNSKMLAGNARYYRIRAGSYRLGFRFMDGTVLFLRCLHRKDIYRYFP